MLNGYSIASPISASKREFYSEGAASSSFAKFSVSSAGSSKVQSFWQATKTSVSAISSDRFHTSRKHDSFLPGRAFSAHQAIGDWGNSTTATTNVALTQKVKIALKKYSNVVSFEPSFNDGNGAFYIPKEKISVSVVWEFIAFGFTDEEITNLLDIASPDVVRTVRAFIHRLL